MYTSNDGVGKSDDQDRSGKERESLLLQGCADELRMELEVDACVIGKIVGEINDQYVVILKESISEGMNTRKGRYEIDQGILQLIQMGASFTSDLDLIHENCVTVHDIEEVRRHPFARMFTTASYDFPERALISTPIVYEKLLKGTVVCSSALPRRWGALDREIIREVTEDIAIILELTESLGTAFDKARVSKIFSPTLPLSLDSLSPENRAILNCLTENITNREIAVQTGIPYSSVRRSVHNLLKWVGVGSKKGLEDWAKKEDCT
jgi:DNA-binding CsgD family transcriptional regulator